MRIPSWLVVIFSLGGFFVLTTLCSVVSYSFVRTAVIDAADQGVQIPSVVEFVEYMINPPDAEDVFGVQIADVMTSTPLPSFELQPTTTPDPNAIQPTQPAIIDEQPTVAETPSPTPSNQISLTDFLGNSSADDGEETDAPTTEPIGISPEEEALLAEIPAWQDLDRINILLMGTDERGDEQFEDRFRTDTMIIVQIDPIRKTMGVLSFPRDLWVRIPGFAQPNKITFANYLGDGSDLPGGGPALAMETIRENFGIRAEYFIQINFDVFLKVVDLIAPNGVELCVNEHILDTHYPDEGRGTIVVEFEIGCQLLNAERLLQYARTRATYGGDYDRNRRQQEVLNALQKHLLSADGLGSMIASIPSVYSELAGSYRTNLEMRQLMALAGLILQVPNENITYGQINALHVTPSRTADGLDILIPNNIAISSVISETFDPQPNLSIGELRTLAQQENASITILNNTDIFGLAGRAQEWMTSQGIHINSVGNTPDATFDTSATLILDYTGKPNTVRLLRDLMGLQPSAVRVGAGSQFQSSADVLVILGQDAAAIIGE